VIITDGGGHALGTAAFPLYTIGGGGGGVISVSASAPITSSGGVNPNIALTLNANNLLTVSGAALTITPAAPSVNVLTDASTFSAGAATSLLRSDCRFIATTAAPSAASVTSDAGATAQGAATSSLRSDATFTALTAVPSVNVLSDASTFSQGTSTSLLRADCRFIATTAAPSSTGAANSQGVATSLARSDHVHLTVAYTTAQNATVNLTQRRILNISNGLTATDNGGTGATDVVVTPADTSIAVAAGGIRVASPIPTAITFSAAGTALTVTNNVTISGTLTCSTVQATGGVALTLTGNASSTWSTTAGALSVGGTTGTNVQVNSITVVAYTATTAVLTQGVATSGSPTAWTVTGGAHTTLAASTEATDLNYNLARTVQFATGALVTQRAVRFQAPTYAFVGASTITTASTVEISGPPVAGTNATITTALALNVASGNIQVAGTVSADGGFSRITSGTMNIGTAGLSTTISVGSSVTTQTTITTTTLTETQNVATTGSPNALVLTAGAHTTLTASAEATDVNYNLARTVQFATGALATQRAYRVQAPTYAFVGASTITNAYTVEITGPPVAGTNATLTNTWALNVASGNIAFSGGNLQEITCRVAGGQLRVNGNLTAADASTDIIFRSQATRTAGNIISVSNLNTTNFQVSFYGGINQPQIAVAGGSRFLWTATGAAHTQQIASTESPDINLNLARTVQFATGALTTQRAVLVQAPTYAFVAASTLTNAATFAITAAPTAGTNATLTNSYALWVIAGRTQLDGNVEVGGAGTSIGFFGTAVAAQQAGVENITNNVTAGGVNGTIADFAGVLYATDAGTIRDDIYQLARSLAQVKNALRLYGLLS